MEQFEGGARCARGDESPLPLGTLRDSISRTGVVVERVVTNHQCAGPGQHCSALFDCTTAFALPGYGEYLSTMDTSISCLVLAALPTLKKYCHYLLACKHRTKPPLGVLAFTSIANRATYEQRRRIPEVVDAALNGPTITPATSGTFTLLDYRINDTPQPHRTPPRL